MLLAIASVCSEGRPGGQGTHERERERLIGPERNGMEEDGTMQGTIEGTVQ